MLPLPLSLSLTLVLVLLLLPLTLVPRVIFSIRITLLLMAVCPGHGHATVARLSLCSLVVSLLLPRRVGPLSLPGADATEKRTACAHVHESLCCCALSIRRRLALLLLKCRARCQKSLPQLSVVMAHA